MFKELFTEAKSETLIIKDKSGKSLVPKNMKDTDGYQTYTSKRIRTVEDMIEAMGLEEENGHLVLNNISKERIPYWTKLLTSNFKAIGKDIKIEVK